MTTDLREKPSAVRRFLLPSWRQRKHMLRRDAWGLVVGSYALLLLAWFWPEDLRNTSPVYNIVGYGIFMTWTFVWHLGVLLTAVAAIAAWQRSWRLVLATIPLLGVCLGGELRHYLPKWPAAPTGQTITVMSVNLLYSNLDTTPIIREIRTTEPDILLLQEYTPAWHRDLQQSIGQDYPYVVESQRESPFGAAIYSRLPLEDVNTFVPLGNTGTPQLRAVIQADGRKIALYNIHLLPPYGLEYTRYTRAQLADLIDVLREEPLPVILSGDFNFTDRSPNAAGLHAIGLIDTHTVAGSGRGSTWPVNSFYRYVPGIRLDHIYLRDGITCSQSRTGTGTGSDHRPILARIGWLNRAGGSRK